MCVRPLLAHLLVISPDKNQRVLKTETKDCSFFVYSLKAPLTFIINCFAKSWDLGAARWPHCSTSPAPSVARVTNHMWRHYLRRGSCSLICPSFHWTEKQLWHCLSIHKSKKKELTNYGSLHLASNPGKDNRKSLKKYSHFISRE